VPERERAQCDRVLGILGVGVVDADTPVFRADDAGVLRGDGCFESLLVADAAVGRVEQIDLHLARLARSAARLDLPAPPAAAWRGLIAEVLAAWAAPGEAVLRLVLTRGVEPDGEPTGFALMSPVPAKAVRQRDRGISVVTLGRGMPADAHEQAPWLLGGVKTLSYAINMAAQRHAAAGGADDVIFVTTDGVLLEGPTATVVWSAGGVWHTPPADDLGILDGTTVRAAFARLAAAGEAVAVARGTLADLRAADGVWLVSSIRLVAPVTTLDGRPCPVPADLTARLRVAATAGNSVATGAERT
jgi:4-amino-4-deoxychorismate lyase